MTILLAGFPSTHILGVRVKTDQPAVGQIVWLGWVCIYMFYSTLSNNIAQCVLSNLILNFSVLLYDFLLSAIMLAVEHIIQCTFWTIIFNVLKTISVLYKLLALNMQNAL